MASIRSRTTKLTKKGAKGCPKNLAHALLSAPSPEGRSRRTEVNQTHALSSAQQSNLTTISSLLCYTRVEV